MCRLLTDNYKPMDNAVQRTGVAYLFRQLSMGTASIVSMSLFVKAAGWKAIHHLIRPLAELLQDGHLVGNSLLIGRAYAPQQQHKVVQSCPTEGPL